MRIISIVFSAVMICTMVGWSQEDSPSRAKIAGIKAGLVGDSGNEDAASVLEQIGQLRDLIRMEILDQLNVGQERPEGLKDQLQQVFSSDWQTPASVVHDRINGSDFVLVGYSVVHGSSALPSATSVIEAFQKIGAHYEQISSTGDELEGYKVQLEVLSSPWPNEIWILAHGQQMRVMQYHEKLRIYSFDGQKFKVLWAPTPKRSPSFKISKDTIALTYEDESGEHPAILHQTLILTPGGVTETTALP